MEKNDNNEFGKFLLQLRKEKRLTQRELAQKLYISDKAVSKWERGLSMPDIALLMPLSQILGVTATELLSGKRIEENRELSVPEVESLMNRTIHLSEEEKEQQSKNRQNRIMIFFSCVFIVGLELLLMHSLGYTVNDFSENLLTVELLMLIFGIYLTFFLKETLPIYYDENDIRFYSDGFFRMNIPGIHFNNSNWKHIVYAAHLSVMSIFTLFPLLYLAISRISPTLWEKGELIFTLGSVLSMFIPIYVAGKKYA